MLTDAGQRLAAETEKLVSSVELQGQVWYVATCVALFNQQ
jgi:hypothetical protein